MIALAIVTCALGNRTWGDSSGKHWLGALVMAYGMLLANPENWRWFPMLFISALVFRMWTTRPFLKLTNVDYDKMAYWLMAFGRAVWFVAIPFSMFIITGHYRHLFEGYFFALVPAIYYCAGKQTPYTGFECVAIAELLTGALIGACAI